MNVIHFKLIHNDTPLFQLPTDGPINANIALFQLKYHIEYIEKKLLKNTHIEIYDKNTTDNTFNKLTFQYNDCKLYPNNTYYIKSSKILQRNCITTLNNIKCTNICINDDIYCAEHVKSIDTYNIFLDENELINEFSPYIDSSEIVSFCKYIIENQLNNIISLYCLNSTNNITKYAYDSIKQCIRDRSYTIINSVLYIPYLQYFLDSKYEYRDQTLLKINNYFYYNDIFNNDTRRTRRIKSNDGFICIKSKKFTSDKIIPYARTQISKIDSTSKHKPPPKVELILKNKPESEIEPAPEIEPVYKCSICFDDFTHMHIIKCSHGDIICKSCICDFIKSQINDCNSCQICPLNNQHKIDINDIHHDLSREQLQNIYINEINCSLDIASRLDQNIKVCPFCKSSYVNLHKPKNNMAEQCVKKIEYIQDDLIELKYSIIVKYPMIENIYTDSREQINKNDCIIAINNISTKYLTHENVMKLFNQVSNVLTITRFPLCDIFTIIENNVQIPQITHKIKNILCKKCNNTRCISCNKKKHDGECNDYIITSQYDVQLQVNNFIDKIKTDMCPCCNVSYFKVKSECNLIYCNKCEKSFCHLCKLQIMPKQGQKYWHFGSKKEYCPLYGDVRNTKNFIENNKVLTRFLLRNLTYLNEIIQEFKTHSINIDMKILEQIINKYLTHDTEYIL